MQLKDYIKGNRRGKDANRLEREAMNDSFLQGALDGFDSVAGDHAEIIEKLEKKYTRPAIALKSKNKTLLFWATAASILLVIGISTFFFHVNKIYDNYPSIAEAISYDIAEENDLLIPAKEETGYLRERQAVDNVTNKAAAPPTSQMSKPTTEQRRSIQSESDNIVESSNTISIADLMDHKVIIEEPAKKEQAGQLFRGKVVDETGGPLIGVSIVEKGTLKGAVTDIDGSFTFQLSAGDSSKLIARYLGYEPQEIDPSIMNQTITLREDLALLDKVVVVGYGTQRKVSTTGAATSESVRRQFGEKEFQSWCVQNAEKNVCAGKSASVRVSFFVETTGRPANFEFQNYTCEEAKKVIEKLLSSSPDWTNTNRKVVMTIKW